MKKKENLFEKRIFELDSEIQYNSIIARGSLDEYEIPFKIADGTQFSKLGKFFYREYESLIIVGENEIIVENVDKSRIINNFINDLLRFRLIKEKKDV